jgi:hypothetical protein
MHVVAQPLQQVPAHHERLARISLLNWRQNERNYRYRLALRADWVRRVTGRMTVVGCPGSGWALTWFGSVT